jgi:hypothetical protein
VGKFAYRARDGGHGAARICPPSCKRRGGAFAQPTEGNVLSFLSQLLVLPPAIARRGVLPFGIVQIMVVQLPIS